MGGAERCSVVVAAEDVSRALNVPVGATSTLTVRGIAFGGFTAGGGLVGPAAILLRGGSQHRIEGNQFGGIGATVIGNAVAVRVGLGNNTSTIVVGGPAPSQRNVIGNSRDGILINGEAAQGTLIASNQIGGRWGGLPSCVITSEFSACMPIEQASDLIYRNGFEQP